MSRVRKYLGAYADYVIPLRIPPFKMLDPVEHCTYLAEVSQTGAAVISRESHMSHDVIELPEPVMAALAKWAAAYYLDEA